MFNQRPTSLLGLEPRHDVGEYFNFISPMPMLSTPDEYIKYFDYFLARERLTDPTLPATTPNSLGPNPTINHQQFHHHHQQHQIQQQQQQIVPQVVPQQHTSTSQQVDQLQYHQQSQLQHFANQQAQQQLNQQPSQQTQLPAEIQEAPSLTQNFEQSKNIKHEDYIPLGTSQEPDQIQVQPQIIKESCQNQVSPPPNTVSDRAKLSEEEKIRNKRERNRRAAANCRRRKDEKLKQLSDENTELRKTIENLQNVIISLQARLPSGCSGT